ncbi:MAG: LacI family DNA-binding transcriptional regulator [Anaerolineae bacterium]|nr:LacI family DNA-binding transcriptional regulator [Anaerolineae bacterium]
MKRLTLEEIGELAGVSRATVSRVINNYPHIRPEVRERVERVIRETGYEPNLVARSLASNRSNILGLVIPSAGSLLFSDPYFPRLIQGISQGCDESDYTLALFLFQSEQKERNNLHSIYQKGILDGIIITASVLADPHIPQMIEYSLPFVMIGRPATHPEINYVDVDSVGGAFTAVDHLARLGYRRIATITADPDSTVGIDRRAGYIDALTHHGLPVEDARMCAGDFTRESGRAAMECLLPQRPDAVFAATDAMAIGAMQAIEEAGLSVPDDVAVVGFDDFTLAENADPPLTTIRQPVQQTGRIAVQVLQGLLDGGGDDPQHIVLPTELVIRASCGASRS